MEFARVAPVLRAVALSAGANEAFDPITVAAEVGRDVESVLADVDGLQDAGLMLMGDDGEGHVPLFTHAGRQYLARAGAVDEAALHYLASVIDDINARAALVMAAACLVDEFRDAVVSGQATSHARELVPPAFSAAADERMAIDLFAASVALASRLGLGEPAGCLAEEVVAVELLAIADNDLEARCDAGLLVTDEAEHARAALSGLFELFGDDDVLELFDMVEPADASVAGHSSTHQQMGKVDQRVEAWFRPFNGTGSSVYDASDGSD